LLWSLLRPAGVLIRLGFPHIGRLRFVGSLKASGSRLAQHEGLKRQFASPT